MDPLSIIASTIAISQALGFGIKTLQCLGNAPTDFCNMLNELSTLSGLLGQLRTATDSISDSTSPFPADAVDRLELLKVELSQVVNEMKAIETKLVGKVPKPLNKKGEHKISRTDWQLIRGKIARLRGRAKECRENLVACFGLLGFSQQYVLAPSLSLEHPLTNSTAGCNMGD